MYITNGSGQAPYNTARLINTSSGAYLTTGGTWTNATKGSDLRGDITPLDGKQVLEKLSQLRVGEWSSKWEEESIKHIGPMAEDFYAQFGLGYDDGSISTIDPAGIALVAIQELYRTQQELKGKTEEIIALKTQLEQANLQLSQLSAAVETILATQNEPKSGDDKWAINR
jgi:hypothetical protein